jgi:hypothetical protein
MYYVVYESMLSFNHFVVPTFILHLKIMFKKIPQQSVSYSYIYMLRSMVTVSYGGKHCQASPIINQLQLPTQAHKLKTEVQTILSHEPYRKRMNHLLLGED